LYLWSDLSEVEISWCTSSKWLSRVFMNSISKAHHYHTQNRFHSLIMLLQVFVSSALQGRETLWCPQK
jgi:hypothetical protein